MRLTNDDQHVEIDAHEGMRAFLDKRHPNWNE